MIRWAARYGQAVKLGFGAMLLMTTSISAAAEVWTAPAVVSTDVNNDGGRTRVATDRLGRWAAAWQRSSTGPALYSRSFDNANTWSTAKEFPTPSGFNSLGTPDVAAAITSGTFVGVWSVDNGDNKPEIASAFAPVAETNYSALSLPISYTNGAYEGLLDPAVAGGGDHVWVTAASSPSGADDELPFFRTTNDASTWLFAQRLNQSSDPGFNRHMSLASDFNGHWVSVWERRYGSVNTPTSTKVFYTRSTDNGVTWAPPLNFNIPTPAGSQPVVAGDAVNNFVTLYVQGTGASSLKAYRTSDAGATWAGPVAVNASGPAISDTPANPDLACDGQGNCVAVWEATRSGSSRKQIFYATSVNRGQTWTTADVLTTGTGDVADEQPQIEYDGTGKWVAVWQRTTFPAGTVQIVSSKLIFPIRADLSVTQTDHPDPAISHQDVTYSITVRNDGPSSATNVIATITLPTSGTATVTHSQGTHTQTSGTVVWTIGSLAVGSIATAQVTVQLNGTGIFKNTVVLSSTEADIDTQDRTSVETTRLLIEGIDLQGDWKSFQTHMPRRPDHGRLRVHAKLNVSNFGTKRAPRSVVLFMFSDDEILSDDDAFAASITIDPIESGKSQVVRLDREFRRRIPWMGRYLIAILDSEKRITEADEDNNVVMSELLEP